MPAVIKKILWQFWDTTTEMSPYLLFGFFMAGILSIAVSKRLVQQHLGSKGFWSILKAAALGVPLPLCSCSVIPVSMSLRDHGASRGSTIAFLLSAPQTGADSIFVTLSLLGPVFAVFRPLTALITGIIGGALTSIMDHSVLDVSADAAAPVNKSCCCSNKEPDHKHNKFKQAFIYSFITLPGDIGKALLIGLVLAALMDTLIPDGFFAEKLGTGIFAMVIMMVLGIPMYVCATASVPIAAALILKGISPGAALVFLMTGPATNAASLAIIWKVLGRTTAIVYIITVALCALGGGLILDQIIGIGTFKVITGSDTMLNPVIKHISGIVLIGLIAGAVFTRKKVDRGSGI